MNANDEINLAYKIRHALNENLEHMPKAKTDRLALARKAALARKKPEKPARVLISERALVSGTKSFNDNLSWLGKMSMVIPLLVLALGLVSIYEMEERQRIDEIADIDAEVLSDELPVSAYLDHGFNAYLANRGE